MENIAPLYKILCLCLIFLVPLAPAFFLYKIAPNDRFWAKGNFSGFTINATGATAIYIVLFASLYPRVSFILSGIDDVIQLQHEMAALKKNRPWKVEYNLKLMTDSTHEINDMEYQNAIKPDSILCSPRTLRFDPDTKQLTFYIDNDIFERMNGTIKGCIVLRNGFGTASFMTSPNKEQVENRLIQISSIYYKQSTKSYVSGIAINNPGQRPLSKKNSSNKPPVVN